MHIYIYMTNQSKVKSNDPKVSSRQPVMVNATFNVMVPTKPALTVTGSFSAFSASAFSFKSLRTTSPAEFKSLVGITMNKTT